MTERQQDQKFIEDLRAEYLRRTEDSCACWFDIHVRTDAGTFTWEEWQRMGRP